MLDWGFGLGAFGMFFLYDWNRVFLKKRWFVPLFAAGNLLLAVVGGRMVYAGNMNRVMLSLCLSFLNLLYAWYQDRLIFVEEFSDYREYREQVPFLLPRLWKRR